ncbi:MAG: ABC transporter ATP-binding protein [Thermoprotei archaeon]
MGQPIGSVPWMGSKMEMGVEVKDLAKYYTAPTLTKALDGVSFEVGQGEVFGLLGENGAGKTTLVKVLATLLLPDRGTARVAGHDVVKEPSQVRMSIGYAGQDSEKSAYWRLTARENLVYFSVALHGMKREEAEARIEEYADQLGFSKLDREFSSLSGGEKQMVIIIRSLLHDPSVVFMDEPSKSLDPLAARRMRDFVRKLARDDGVTVMLTTHNMQEAEELCDRLAFLDGGKLVFVGSPAEFKRVEAYEVIEVDADLNEVESVPGLVEIRRGASTKLLVTDTSEALPAVIGMLREKGIKTRLRVEGPSLEDAYLHFARQGDEP